MRVRRGQSIRGLLAGLLVLPLAGCGIVADMFDPGLLMMLGIDPTGGSQGVVIVSFRNATTFPAQFLAYEALDATDVSRDARNFSLAVGPGEVGNEVLFCPVGVISPGVLGADFARETTAALVTTEGGVATVAYGGPVLVVGDAYRCGDVIEIGLEPAAGTGGDAGDRAFRITVRIIRG